MRKLNAMSTLAVTMMSCFSSFSYAAETPWEKYLIHPSAENARLVQTISRSSSDSEPGYSGESELNILRTQVIAGDREAFRATYRLALKADGGMLEDLMAILASAIRPQPRMFLREVATLQMRPAMLQSVLEMAGLEYIDRPNAQIYELKMRRQAIKSIQPNDNPVVTQRCFKILDESISKSRHETGHE